jgi:hypothetical protein
MTYLTLTLRLPYYYPIITNGLLLFSYKFPMRRLYPSYIGDL